MEQTVDRVTWTTFLLNKWERRRAQQKPHYSSSRLIKLYVKINTGAKLTLGMLFQLSMIDKLNIRPFIPPASAALYLGAQPHGLTADGESTVRSEWVALWFSSSTATEKCCCSAARFFLLKPDMPEPEDRGRYANEAIIKSACSPEFKCTLAWD